MTDHAVVIAGGGTTGMMLAAELALADIDVVIVERRASQELDGSRSGGLHSRTIEVLDQRGVADRFLAEGQQHTAAGFAYIPLDITDFPTRHNYLLALWQRDFERILAGWVAELGVPIRRACEVVGFDQDPGTVEVHLSTGSSLQAGYLVGCDGGRSVVRKATEEEFFHGGESAAAHTHSVEPGLATEKVATCWPSRTMGVLRSTWRPESSSMSRQLAWLPLVSTTTSNG